MSRSGNLGPLDFVLLCSSQEGRPREGCRPRRKAEAHSEGSPGEEAAAGLNERRRSADACDGRPREGCRPRRKAEAHSEGSPGKEAAAGLNEQRRSADACDGQ
jgi:hypothetical protein